ncbi:MAG: hypothetical protein WC627_00095 [Legionella sp.]|jgi:serine/threonine protein kinase
MSVDKQDKLITHTDAYIVNFQNKHKKMYQFTDAQLHDNWLKSITIFKNSLSKYRKQLTQEDCVQFQEATKFLYRYAKYLDKDPDPETKKWFLNTVKNITDAKNLTSLIDYCNEVASKYDQQFSNKDWEQAQTYFKQHPEKHYVGSQNELMYSYIKVSESVILRRHTIVGEGSFGTVRSSIDRMGLHSDYLIKSQKFSDQVKKEAGIIEDLGQSDYMLVIRTDGSPTSVRKSFQPIIHLGITLSNYLLSKPKIPFNDKLELAIDVLLKISDLHDGKASKSNKHYAHLDIKPDNIVINAQNKIQFIDFGTSKEISDTNDQEIHKNNCTTIGYSPIDIEVLRELENSSPQHIPDFIQSTPNYFFDDRIALLRTLYHPRLASGIFTESQFSILPIPIQDLIDTSIIANQINVYNKYPLKLIAAVLIEYKKDKARLWSYTDIDTLAADEKRINEIIDNYKIISSFKQNSPKENIYLITQRKIAITDIPVNLLNNNYIKAFFDNNAGDLNDINMYLLELLTDNKQAPYELRKDILNYLIKEQVVFLKNTLEILTPKQLSALIEFNDNEDTLLNLMLQRNDLSYKTLTEIKNQATQSNTFANYIEKISHTEATKNFSRIILVGPITPHKAHEKLKIQFCDLINQLENETMGLLVENSKTKTRENTEKFNAALCTYTALKESFTLYDGQKIDKDAFCDIAAKAIQSSLPKLAKSQVSLLQNISSLLETMRTEKEYATTDLRHRLRQLLFNDDFKTDNGPKNT